MKVQPETTKLYLAGFCLLMLALIVFVQAAFNLDPLFSPSEPTQIVLLYTLSTFIFLVLLIFGFVLLRALVKVWIERKQQKPGSKFKTSILVSLISLTLIPATCLFLFAFGLVNRSIVKWFSVPVDQIFNASADMNAEWQKEHEAIARSILLELDRAPDTDLDELRQTFRLKAIIVIDDRGTVLRSSAEPDVAAAALGTQIRSNVGNAVEAFLDIDSYWVVVRRTPPDGNIMAALFPRPERILQLAAKIAQEREHYNALVQNQRLYRDTYVYILILMTVLILFAAVWTGLFLSKRITIPIEALSEATREISSGNLDHRVHVQAQDELGLLVRLFNDMAGQLQATTRELEARRRLMEIILESIPTGVISVDRDLRANKINRAGRAMFSSENANTLEEIFGQDFHTVSELLSASDGNSITREIEFNVHGRPAHVAVTVTRLMTGGFVLVIEDLTEVVRAQKASAWREVARRLAHEIKNPLTPIQLCAERLRRHFGGAAEQTRQLVDECTSTIVGEVESLKGLVDEFSQFARMPVPRAVPTDLLALLTEALALYNGIFTAVEIRRHFEEPLPTVSVDSEQIRRGTINPVDNATEATDQRGVIETDAHHDRVNNLVRVVVADDGPGIPPAEREKLFLPYYSTKRRGSGLGLAIVRRIVAEHGGSIDVSDNTPRGTRFAIELPA